MSADLGIWAPGDGYGPVLPQLQLYQLRAQLRINPILERKTKDFNLTFDVRTGEAGGLTAGRLPVELAGHRMEPATHPRVQQLYLITNRSPWYTLIENKDGVTVGDVFNQVTLDYRKYITDFEWKKLEGYDIERIRRIHDQEERNAYAQGVQLPPPPQSAMIAEEGRAYRRYMWLRDYHFFEILTHDDKLAQERFGFKAPDVLVMVLSQ